MVQSYLDDADQDDEELDALFAEEQGEEEAAENDDTVEGPNENCSKSNVLGFWLHVVALSITPFLKYKNILFASSVSYPLSVHCWCSNLFPFPSPLLPGDDAE